MSITDVLPREDPENERLRYLGKVEEIAFVDREFVSHELFLLAGWIKTHYPALNFREIRKLLFEMLTVSI